MTVSETRVICAHDDDAQFVAQRDAHLAAGFEILGDPFTYYMADNRVVVQTFVKYV